MSGYFSDELLEEVKSSNDIVDVISEYVRLKRSGRNYFGLCPFHTEKTPSFSVSPEKQIYYCFGCGTGGNVFHFISRIENLEFVESVRHLAERVGMHLPEEGDMAAQPEKVRLKQRILEMNLEAARYFHQNLNDSKAADALRYLKDRGISTDIIKRFGLGFAFGINNDLASLLKLKGFGEEEIVEAGLAYKSKRNILNDKFRARIIFPILDVRDRVIGFGGRVLDNSMPKYLNSPETLVFNKRKNLYGLNLAKKSNEKKVIVVEGYMDVISLYQHGIENAAASLGTSFTQEQGRLLRKYFDEIIISFDADTAGQNAAVRGLDLLNDMGIPVRVIKLLDAKDPDELVRKKGVKLFRDLVKSAKSLAEFKIDILKEQHDLNDVRGKIGFLNKMAAVLAKVQNNIERDAYVRKISEETGIAVEPIYAEISKQVHGRNKVRFRVPENARIERPRTAKTENRLDRRIIQTEKMLIALMSLGDKELFGYISKKIKPDDFRWEPGKCIVEKIVKAYDQLGEVTHSEILNRLEEQEEINLFSEIMQGENNFEDNYKVADELLGTVERGKIEARIHELHVQMKEKNINAEELRKLDEELKTLTFALGAMKKPMQKGGVNSEW